MYDTGVNPGPICAVRHISGRQVEKAHELASRGQQELYDISDRETTVFRSCVSCDEHFAAVEVDILPTWPTPLYAVYELNVRYQPCCHFAFQDARIDHEFQSEIQLIYDTYILPTRRKIDDGWYEEPSLLAIRAELTKTSRTKIPPADVTDASSTCTEKKRQCVLKWSNCHEADDLTIERTSADSPIVPPEAGEESSPVTETPRQVALRHQNPPIPAGDRREIVKVTESRAPEQEQAPTKKRAKKTVKQEAETIVKSVERGMDKIRKRHQKAEKRRLNAEKRQRKQSKSSTLNIMDAPLSDDTLPIIRYKSLEDVEKFQNSDQSVRLKQLRALEQRFVAYSQKVTKRDSWNFWYCAASFSYIRYTYGGKLERRAKAVRVINKVFHQLWLRDGPAALMFFIALAGKQNDNPGRKAVRLTGTERKNTMCIASRLSDQDQDELGRHIIEGLAGKLEDPPLQYEIPVPALWVGVLLGITFQEACTALEMKAFGTLELQSDWEVCQDGLYEPSSYWQHYRYLRARSGFIEEMEVSDDAAAPQAKRLCLEENNQDAESAHDHDNRDSANLLIVSPDEEASLARPLPCTSHDEDGASDSANSTRSLDDIIEIDRTASAGHEDTHHQPKRRRLDGVAPVAFDEQIPDTNSGLRLIQPQSGNSMDFNNFTQNDVISETQSAQHPSNTHHEGSPLDTNSNESNKSPDVHMDGVTMEVIEDHRLHDGSRDEHCSGNDVARMPMNFASEQGSLDVHLHQNGNTASSNVPPDQFTSNMTEVSVDKTTLPERSNGFPCRVGEEAPRNQIPPSTEVVESSNIHGREAEAGEQIAGTAWTSSNETTTNGREDSESEPEEVRRKRRRVDDACTDAFADSEDVNPGTSVPDDMFPRVADNFPNDGFASDDFNPHMEMHNSSGLSGLDDFMLDYPLDQLWNFDQNTMSPGYIDALNSMVLPEL
ncbi:hypothetical protein PV08_08998 [Exophiala spinifera]|uniref:Uncharacterized protein n=1 Tax=Exophiala spinifera TaxID=91928 RepID=A0A0D1YFE2_9EURO|nr:uncharacterized protein PV08_08998 [Exophiala spinifera]KIW13806.1 hypothetical protein PV08_08998 [Exophiala spinifera]